MAQTSVADPRDKIATHVPLSKLELDRHNPRFGGLATGDTSQDAILDHIVNTFGVDDVLSSLAVNGYFKAEPLVGRRTSDTDVVTVAEGNRRLAACLILTGDERAKRHKGRTQQYQAIWEQHGKPSVDPLPVIVFDATGDQNADDSLLSYLGVRHIAASQPWDSYAKAAWVSKVVEANNLSVADVSRMIGDQHRTVSRLLEGYYFIQQAIEVGAFRPADSVRSGRGSVTAYPFSWVYTALGYSSTRSFLEIGDDGPKQNPLSESSYPKARIVLRAMFGDRSKGQSAAIADSREIGDLAAALASPDKVALLEQGMTLAEIIRKTKPVDEKLRQGFATIRSIQAEILSALSEDPVDERTATVHLPIATMVRRGAVEIERKLQQTMTPGDDD